MEPADENPDLYRFLVQKGLIHDVREVQGPYGYPGSNSSSSYSYSSCTTTTTTTDFSAMHSLCSSSSYYPLDLSGITDTPPHDRALAALKNHKEAEKRRRERINSHLDKLRTLLPCNSKVPYISVFLIITSYIYRFISLSKCAFTSELSCLKFWIEFKLKFPLSILGFSHLDSEKLSTFKFVACNFLSLVLNSWFHKDLIVLC